MLDFKHVTKSDFRSYEVTDFEILALALVIYVEVCFEDYKKYFLLEKDF